MPSLLIVEFTTVSSQFCTYLINIGQFGRISLQSSRQGPFKLPILFAQSLKFVIILRIFVNRTFILEKEVNHLTEIPNFKKNMIVVVLNLKIYGHYLVYSDLKTLSSEIIEQFYFYFYF